jgi:hypothetical protein
MSKGLLLLMSSSPDCNIDRTFTSTFCFPYTATKINKKARVYRNPIYLAKEYKKMIDGGQVRNQSGLVKKTQYLKG